MASSASPIADDGAAAVAGTNEDPAVSELPAAHGDRPHECGRHAAVAPVLDHRYGGLAVGAQAGEPDDPAVDHGRETQPVVGEQLGDQGRERFRIGARPPEESLLGTQRGGELLAGFDEARVIGGDDEKV